MSGNNSLSNKRYSEGSSWEDWYIVRNNCYILKNPKDFSISPSKVGCAILWVKETKVSNDPWLFKCPWKHLLLVTWYCWSLMLLLATKSLQLCTTLYDPIGGSPPGSPVPGILQARTLEWVAISFSSAWKWKVNVKSLSRVLLLVTPRTVAYKSPPSTGFSRQEYWSGLLLPSPLLASNHQLIILHLTEGT